ncbi:aminotransferase class IV [Natroniella sulfidigena]|uniref:aminotransferase class IV n=1 Tax=Natroniella sulfidigena TaxID=723921 RepID=UPI00200A050A|nr:aminotransferase class IV [Natroniella sulfidigena]MCK8815809.1 aminotransferase class IV [Natroniella sulfidigena]
MKNKLSFSSELAKFGVGLFETMKVIGGRVIFLEEHLDRLYDGLADLEIPIEVSKEELEQEILDYVEGMEDQALRVTVCDEGYNFSTREIPYQPEDYQRGYKVMLAPLKRGQSTLYQYKTTNYFASLYSKRAALKKGYDEALFVNLDDLVLEGSMTNLFFIAGDKVVTPKSDLGLLPGIIRGKVIEIVKELGVELELTEIKLAELDRFEAVFATNSLVDLIKVKEIEDISYEDNNRLFAQIKQCFKEQVYGFLK